MTKWGLLVKQVDFLGRNREKRKYTMTKSFSVIFLFEKGKCQVKVKINPMFALRIILVRPKTRVAGSFAGAEAW